jgi:uncharacterized protein YcbX
MEVSQIWRYPVKSMMGASVSDAELVSTGIVADRTWATRDLERGGIRGAKKLHGLMRFAAEDLEGGHVRITTPDSLTVDTTDDDVDDVVSAALGHRVRLERLRPADDLEHYLRGPGDLADPIAEVRSVLGREDDEPLPDFSVFPPEIATYESPPGTYHDAYPLVVMTESSLAALAAALPDSTIDIRRFRPSMVVDTGDEPGHPEFGWRGRIASVGSAEIEFLAPCPRCVMVTLEVAACVPADRAVLRHIVRDLDQNLGIYARVAQAGHVSVGDPVIFR